MPENLGGQDGGSPCAVEDGGPGMKLCEVLKEYRWVRKVGVSELAAEIGFSASTLSRIEHGEMPSGASLGKVLTWLLREDTPA